MRKLLKVVQLLEPDLCKNCRFAEIITIKLSENRSDQIIHCKRLDCDNWDYTTIEQFTPGEELES